MTEDRRLAVVNDYAGFHAALRARVDELQVTFDTIDEVAGFPSRYTSKLLAPGHTKWIGPMSFDALLGVLGLRLIVVEDVEALARVSARLVKRERPLVYTSEGSINERRVMRLLKKRWRTWSSTANAIRNLKLTPEQRSRIGKKAIRTRWRLHRQRKKAGVVP